MHNCVVFWNAYERVMCFLGVGERSHFGELENAISEAQ